MFSFSLQLTRRSRDKMKVQKLPVEVQSKLQSGNLVTDAVQCVLELVHNSLDAEATGIAVRVDLKTYQIRVIDNGKGIGKDDLEIVGERYMTSKYHSFEAEASHSTYGFRGQALSSLLDVSRTLTIETKSENGGPSFVKVFCNNKALPITKTKCDRSGTGTTVTVEDFMYTMPVRRKRIFEVFDIEEIKSQLQYLAVIHYNVCFTLRNESKGLILLQTPQASSILESVANIYGKTIAKSIKALHFADKKYEVTGFMSMKPQIQSNVQLLYINKRIVSKGVIHKFVNSLIKEYCGKRTLFGDSLTGQIIKRQKSLHNVFIILIKCPHSYYELFTNIRKVTVEFRNWKDPLKCIHRAVKGAFKDILNLDSSSNTQYHDINKKESTKEGRGVFGTSLLVNAVRGAPVKRGWKKKGTKSKKRMKISADERSSINNSIRGTMQSVDNLDSTVHQYEWSNDSLESPIPTKVKENCVLKLKKKSFSQSFLEFYEWLKTKFETDTYAFNLYNEFLHFRKRTIRPEVTQYKSQVLGGKQERKQTPCSRKKNPENERQTPKDLPSLNEEMAILTQNQLKIFPNQHLRMKKAVQFTTEMNITSIPKTLNLDCVRNENFETCNSSLFKKPEVFSTHGRQEYNHSLLSVPSSEMQFTNVIKFRNMSESFLHQSSDARLLLDKTLSTSNTWISHYGEEKNIELCGSNRNFEPLFPWNEVYKNKIPQEYSAGNLEGFLTTCDTKLGLVDFATETKKVISRDVEIQVDTSVLPVKKVNAMAQTFQKVPESLSSGNIHVLSQGVTLTSAENAESNREEHNTHLTEDLLNIEEPKSDFWNSISHMQFEVNNQRDLVSGANEMALDKASCDIMGKKKLSSNEFICLHKSQSSTKVENASKETQTLAVFWSLTEMKYPGDNVGTANTDNSEPKKAEPQLFTLPKTILIEEIECGECIEPGFCVTERHDFVPKGLSPKFLNPETAEVSSLSPSEKCKIKLTVDNTQNEFLATIKWQNEPSDGCLKPPIPNDIIFEMRRKAGENMMNCGNPVVSATLSYCAVKVHNLLHSFAFTRELLSSVEVGLRSCSADFVFCLWSPSYTGDDNALTEYSSRFETYYDSINASISLVLGQLDKKFIVTKMKTSTPRKMELISLFDQHAADERIKLEGLINENISSSGKFVSSRLNPSVECALTESDVRVISDLKQKMLNFGLRVDPINAVTVSVTEVPTFLVKKYENDLKNKKETPLSDVVKALILNIIEEVTETRGAVSKIPKVMHSALCLEACHKAIKFNKPLSADIMIEMITKLQDCKLPFQCAHGRPSVIPIIDLEDFRPTIEENEALDVVKLKKFFCERREGFVTENSV